MEKKKIELCSQTDGFKISADMYIPENPMAIVQIIHGMAEHKERYEEFCTLLTRLNCVVIIADHRGHGESYDDKIPLGYFADKDGWMTNLKDQHMFTQYVKENYRNLPFFLMGHSMGSLFGCSYLKRYEDDLSGLILSGMPAFAKETAMGRTLASVCCKLAGDKGHSKILIKAASPFNAAIKNPRTGFDWLSYNEENVDRYIADELCGFPFTNRGYYDLFSGMMDVFATKDWRVLKKNLPILFVVGQDDPCADVPTGFRKSLDNLADAGYLNIEANVYENMRHEILNESGRKTVYKDIVTWLGARIKDINAQNKTTL